MKKYWFLFVTLLFISLAACDLTDAKNETNDMEEKDLSQFQPEGVPLGSESNYNISLKIMENHLLCWGVCFRSKAVRKKLNPF